MTNFGNQVQFRLYQTMHQPDPNRLPVVYEEWEEKARQVLDDGPYYYVEAGAGAGKTMKANLKAFDNWEIVPRMLRNVETRALNVQLFGHTYPRGSLAVSQSIQPVL